MYLFFASAQLSLDFFSKVTRIASRTCLVCHILSCLCLFLRGKREKISQHFPATSQLLGVLLQNVWFKYILPESIVTFVAVISQY